MVYLGTSRDHEEGQQERSKVRVGSVAQMRSSSLVNQLRSNSYVIPVPSKVVLAVDPQENLILVHNGVKQLHTPSPQLWKLFWTSNVSLQFG